MTKKEVIISDFKKSVKEKEYLSDDCTKDFWETVSYETKNISGNLLIASPETFPQPVTIIPNLQGWHKIYVCMHDTGGGRMANHVHLQLTDDEFSSCISPLNVQSHIQWNHFEQVEEIYWKSANMTNQDITISKVDFGMPFTASVCWIRFVEMTPEEVDHHLEQLQDTASKTMYAHMDGDFSMFDMPQTPRDYCRALFAMKDSDVKIVAQEITNDFHDLDSMDLEKFVGRRAWDRTRAKSWLQFYKWKDEIYKEELSFAHENNMELFAALRMGLSDFVYPMEYPYFKEKFVEEHPEFMCVTRDGRKTEFLSYAYKEVREYVIQNLKKACEHGFDGVSLIFTRGIHVLFEEPVVKRFAEKYGQSLDCKRLPMTDRRIHGIWCDIMTEFMQELRKELDTYSAQNHTARIKIYATTLYTVPEGQCNGFDIERWAREGLIDGIVQSKMTLWEDIEDVLGEDGLVDIERYSQKSATQYVVRRSHGNEINRIVEGLKEYRRIADEYNLKLYSEIQWEGTVSPVEFVKATKEIYKNGGQHIALWDCYPHRVMNAAEWQCTSNFGGAEKVQKLSEEIYEYHKVHKILSYNGKDMRYYHPGWKG